MADRLDINMSAVHELIKNSPEWQRYCSQVAAQGLAHARSIAPVVTGQYRASLYGRVEHTTDPDAVAGSPAIVIGTDSDHGLEVEFQEPHRYLTLLRTFDSLRGRI